MSYKPLLDKAKPEFEKSIEHFATELNSIRTGRANTALVENIMVESYGAMTPIKNLASISIPEAKSVVIQPWDKSLLSAIEKAISASSLGITPVNDGNFVRLSLPMLTEERRLTLVKTVKQMAEAARVRVRNAREDVWKTLTHMHKEKTLTEDQKFEAQEELKKIVDGYNKQIHEMMEKKEEEITKI